MTSGICLFLAGIRQQKKRKWGWDLRFEERNCWEVRICALRKVRFRENLGQENWEYYSLFSIASVWFLI